MTPLMQTVYRPTRKLTATMILVIFCTGFSLGILSSCFYAAFQHQHRIEMSTKLTNPVYAQEDENK